MKLNDRGFDAATLVAVDARDYVRLGRRGILELLEREDAAAWREVEARLADQQWPGLGYRIDPHHLVTARQQLAASCQIADAVPQPTRGGRSTSVIYRTDLPGRLSRLSWNLRWRSPARRLP